MVGKGEIACTSNFCNFFFSHNVFSKASFTKASKDVIVWNLLKNALSRLLFSVLFQQQLNVAQNFVMKLFHAEVGNIRVVGHLLHLGCL